MLLKRSVLPLLLLLCTVLVPLPVSAAPLEAAAELPDLAAFKASLFNADARALRGVYAESLFALKVVQQPASDPGYVSEVDGTATQFGMAVEVGVVGLLAHNYLSGGTFSQLEPGQRIDLIYGDGRATAYRVMAIHRYQATAPNSLDSDFIDLDTHEHLSAGNLFAKVYQGSDHVTFQTCIPGPGSSSWGRLFVVAEPVTG